MKLYGYWRSSCSWRARIALGLKGMAFESVPVHLVKQGGEQRLAEYTAKNPMQQVPFLELDAAQDLGSGALLHGIAQSLAIMEYLDELQPEPSLLGHGAAQRARVRWLSEMINSGIQPLQNLFVMHEVERLAPGHSKPWSKAFIERGLAALERTVAGEQSPFLVGDSASMADVCLIPQLYNARRFGIDLSQCPRLQAVEAECLKLEAFASTHPDQQPDAVPD